MALRKPSDLFNQKENSEVFESSEVSSHITESYDKFRSNFEKVNELSEKVEILSQELSEKLTKSDLENAMLSQLMVLDENFKSLQSQVKGLNKQDLKEFKETVVSLSKIVNNIVETDLPKYRKQITKNELYVGEQINQLQDIVGINISEIREDIDEKFDNIAEVVDNNIDYFNQKLEETSLQVKTTTKIYDNLSKVVENKISKENERINNYSKIIQTIQESLGELKTQIFLNEKEFKKIDNYIQEHYQELVELKEEVFAEIQQIPVGNIQENLERLEKKIDYIKETYSQIKPEIIVQEVIKEGLLNEPPETKNEDPLTPLNQNFVTLDQLKEHYRLFINRIQQQLSTLGGGGETQLKYLDDVVGIATNASAYDGKFLTYNHSLGKFEFVTVSGGGGGTQDLNTTLGYGNTSSLGMSVGLSTFNSVIVGGATTALLVNGDARITGILTIGTSSITLDGIHNTLKINGATTIDGSGYAEFAGIVTASSFVGNLTGTASTATTVDILNTNGLTTVYYPIFVESRTDGQILRGDVDLTYRTDTNTLTVPNISATSFSGSGVNLTGIVTYIEAGSGILVDQNTGKVTITSLGGGGGAVGLTIKDEGSTVGSAGSIFSLNFVGDNIIATASGTASTITVATQTYVASAGIATYSSTAGIATVAQGLTGTPNITVGVVTATSYNGSGSNLTGIVTFITAGSGISVNQNTGNVTITNVGAALTGNNVFTGINTFTGSNTFSGSIIIEQASEAFNKYSTTINAASVVNLDCSTGNIHYITSTVGGNWTANLTNVGITSGHCANYTLVINQGTTAYIPNALQIAGVTTSINWQGGSIPTGNNSKKDVIAYTVFDDAGVYTVFGQLVTFG